MAYIGNTPAESFASFEKQVFTIVNSQTAYTLSHSVVNENDIRLVVNNVVQEPGSGKAYTASGTTLTLSAALVNGTDEMYCVFLGRALQTVNAPNASVGSDQTAPTIITGQTELATAPASTDELLISDAGVLKRIDVSLIGGDNTPAFHANNTSNPTWSVNTHTKIAFTNENFDTDSAYDTSTSRFTVPSGEGGKYYIGSTVQLYGTSDYYELFARIYVNGSAENQLSLRFHVFTNDLLPGNINQNFSFGGIKTLSASDYIEVYGMVNAASGNSAINQQSTFFAYKLIGV